MEEVQALTSQQYRRLMEGLKTEQPKANKAVFGLSAILKSQSTENDGFLS